MDILVASDDPGADDVQALAGAYLSFAHDTSPPEHALALDAERLADPSVSFFAIRRGGVLSVGRAKSSTRARARSSPCPPTRRRGAKVSAGDGRARGLGRREPGLSPDEPRDRTVAAFAPAGSLHARVGFVACEPFAH
jgi:putative acetyltransferase